MESSSATCCAICLDSIVEDCIDNSTSTVLSCNHIYHKTCIAKWFNAMHNTCPICRTVIQQHEENSTNSSTGTPLQETMTMNEVKVIFDMFLSNYKSSQNDRERIHFLNKIYDLVHQHNLHYDNRFLHQLNVANIGYYFI